MESLEGESSGLGSTPCKAMGAAGGPSPRAQSAHRREVLLARKAELERGIAATRERALAKQAAQDEEVAAKQAEQTAAKQTVLTEKKSRLPVPVPRPRPRACPVSRIAKDPAAGDALSATRREVSLDQRECAFAERMRRVEADLKAKHVAADSLLRSLQHREAQLVRGEQRTAAIEKRLLSLEQTLINRESARLAQSHASEEKEAGAAAGSRSGTAGAAVAEEAMEEAVGEEEVEEAEEEEEEEEEEDDGDSDGEEVSEEQSDESVEAENEEEEVEEDDSENEDDDDDEDDEDDDEGSDGGVPEDVTEEAPSPPSVLELKQGGAPQLAQTFPAPGHRGKRSAPRKQKPKAEASASAAEEGDVPGGEGELGETARLAQWFVAQTLSNLPVNGCRANEATQQGDAASKLQHL